MLVSLLEQIDQSWRGFFTSYADLLSEIDNLVRTQRIAPSYEDIFKVFAHPVERYRVVIVGQDPYPTPGYATGLAFSVSPSITQLPASLKNIFTEYCSDTGLSYPKNGDLTRWAENGVALLNSSLTLNLDSKAEHLKIGWQQITCAALELLISNGCVAILWGSQAQKMGAKIPESQKIESAHPSPLSAYRDFFGSKPFSKSNQMLVESGLTPINWELK